MAQRLVTFLLAAVIVWLVLVNLFPGTSNPEKPVDKRSYFQAQELTKPNGHCSSFQLCRPSSWETP
ncbi:MAG: hypothetical protein [Caudoviricetes sp.]|nr:MAG: hypothetical protein [Caudoviricetes sp.]